MAQSLRLSPRYFSVFRALKSSLSEPLEVNSIPHEGHYKVWKKVFFFVCVPALILSSVNVYMAEEHERPEFKPYTYMRIRNKKFPWRDGIKSLFHNPHVNALPDGYEDGH